jgi:hypothetical protein
VIDVDRYLKGIVSNLPLDEDEKEELREEMHTHLTEHINELMVQGYTEDEAVLHAIKAFGNERQLNWEMKKVIFPFYKIVRYIWNVIAVTAFLCVVSYFAMKYYHPGSENALDSYTVITGLILVAVIAGVAEIMYEAVAVEYKSKWLTNPILFFMGPALFIGVLMSFSHIGNPEQYKQGLWLDLYAIPIGALAHLISRQLFTLVFVRNRKKNRYSKVN